MFFLFTNNSNIVELELDWSKIEAEADSLLSRSRLHEVGPGEGSLARQSLLDIVPHGCQAGL